MADLGHKYPYRSSCNAGSDANTKSNSNKTYHPDWAPSTHFDHSTHRTKHDHDFVFPGSLQAWCEGVFFFLDLCLVIGGRPYQLRMRNYSTRKARRRRIFKDLWERVNSVEVFWERGGREHVLSSSFCRIHVADEGCFFIFCFCHGALGTRD